MARLANPQADVTHFEMAGRFTVVAALQKVAHTGYLFVYLKARQYWNRRRPPAHVQTSNLDSTRQAGTRAVPAQRDSFLLFRSSSLHHANPLNVTESTSRPSHHLVVILPQKRVSVHPT